MHENESISPAPHNGKNALEWGVFALSTLLIITMTVVLMKETIGWEERPPELEVNVGEAIVEPGAIVAAVEVTNHGDVAAADVRVDIESGERRTQVLFDFIPRQATRNAKVAFPHDGGPGNVRWVGMGHAAP